MVDTSSPQNKCDCTNTYQNSAIFGSVLFELKKTEKLTEDDLGLFGDSPTATSILEDMEDLGWVESCEKDWVAGPAFQQFVGGESGLCEDVKKARIHAICKKCERQLGEKNLNKGPEAPELGWEYFECPNCGHQQRPQ